MHTLDEIRAAIAELRPQERSLLITELLASPSRGEMQAHLLALEAALERGMEDVAAGRVRLVSEAPALLEEWLGKS